MADALKRLVGPTFLGTSAATVYTVPALTTAVMRDVCVCNETGSAATFTLSIGSDAGGTRLYKSVNIPANSTFQRTGNIPLATGEFLQAYSNSGTTLTLTIGGIEST
mgnify:CR=1 FL=1